MMDLRGVPQQIRNGSLINEASMDRHTWSSNSRSILHLVTEAEDHLEPTIVIDMEREDAAVKDLKQPHVQHSERVQGVD